MENTPNSNDIKEIRKIVIQNLNAVNALEASLKEVKTIVKAENRGNKREYVVIFLFITVVILAFYFYFSAQTSYNKEKYSLLKEEQEYLKTNIKELKTTISEMENSDIKAYNLYLALKENSPDKALKQYSDFNLSSLSRLERLVIDRDVSMIRLKAAIIKYEEAETLFKRKSYEAAIRTYDESLKIASTGDHVTTIFYHTALSYYRLKQYDKAAIAFERYLFASTKSSFEKDKAELLLGVCYEKQNQYSRAYEFYNQTLIDNRHSRFKSTIVDRMKNISRKLTKTAEN